MNKQSLQFIPDLSPDGIVCVSTSGLIDYANPAFFGLTGLTSKDILGKNENDLLKLLRELCQKEGCDEDFTGCDVDKVVVIELHTPARRLISCTCRKIDQNPDENSKVLFFHDITRELERDDRVKSEFLSVAAHKLRTPLVSVLGFSELLLKRDFEHKEQMEVLATIYRQAENFKTMLDDFLDIERIDVRHGEDFSMRRVSIEPVILSALEVNRRLSDEFEIEFIPPTRWPMAVLDEERMLLVLNYIINNAVKFSLQASKVSCSIVNRVNANEEEFGVQVVDHGIGMSVDELKRVGDRFYRADDVQSIPGGGLGVALSRRILSIHNGELTLDSVKGEGTTATIWLPLMGYTQ